MVEKELIASLEVIAKCVSDKSNEENKITILENLKPSSLGWILDCAIDYIEQHMPKTL